MHQKMQNCIYYKKGIIKNYNATINGKNFYDKVVDSDIERYKEIRKLTQN